MTRILAIDPGSEQSAWVLYDASLARPIRFAKVPNADVVGWLRWELPDDAELHPDVLVIEWMTPRGMPTSAQEFETLWWAGRFAEAARPIPVERLARDDVKYQLCGRRAKVNDVNVRAALIDRFGGVGGKHAAVGRKASPGPLFGISADVWQALGVAVAWDEKRNEAVPA